MSLLSTYTLDTIAPGNRAVIASMTRSRATNAALAPADLFAAYARHAAAGNSGSGGRGEEAPLAQWNADTFHTGGADRHTDHPTQPTPQTVAH
jgi:hypothetical protein